MTARLAIGLAVQVHTLQMSLRYSSLLLATATTVPAVPEAEATAATIGHPDRLALTTPTISTSAVASPIKTTTTVRMVSLSVAFW